MRNSIKAGDLVTLKSFVHRKNWERVGFVQWTRGNYAAVRWVSDGTSITHPDLSKFPVTQRDITELEAFSVSEDIKSPEGEAASKFW